MRTRAQIRFFLFLLEDGCTDKNLKRKVGIVVDEEENGSASPNKATNKGENLGYFLYNSIIVKLFIRFSNPIHNIRPPSAHCHRITRRFFFVEGTPIDFVTLERPNRCISINNIVAQSNSSERSHRLSKGSNMFIFQIVINVFCTVRVHH